jgi:hypothetical protein
VQSGGTIQVEPYGGPGSAGGSLTIRAKRIDVESGGRISADYAGFRGRIEANGEGPGGGEGGIASLVGLGPAVSLRGMGPLHFTGAGAGGGYGGRAGDGMYDQPRGQWRGGRPYGSADGPEALWGSAGGAPPRTHHEIESLPGGNGGGAITLEAAIVRIGGEVTANGANGVHGEYDSAGGGSGGTVIVRAGKLEVDGRIAANGGRGGQGWDVGGAGGGGRIKLAYARGNAPMSRLFVSPGQGPCPGDEPSPFGCPGTIHSEARGQAFLPLLNRDACIVQPRVAVAVAIDVSRSMTAPSPEGETPLERAVGAASSLLGSLSWRDRAAVVQFASDARPLAPLDTPPGAQAALSTVTVGEGSRVDLGVREATRVLAGALSGERKIIVLVTDGIATPEESAGIDAALLDAARMGAATYALGFGSPAHEPSLIRLAGDPARVWLEPQAEELQEVDRAMHAGCAPAGRADSARARLP